MAAKQFGQLAVIGAGNMGSGIAQKMATEGFEVLMVDLNEDAVARGLGIIEKTLSEGVERKIFKPDQAEAIKGRVQGTADWTRLAGVDLVVEAVFEDEQVKLDVFKRLDEVTRPDTILATNTSSLSVTKLAAATKHPERVIGLHYFYHPAKNRLVEVIPGKNSNPELVAAAWTLQEQIGKTPIWSTDDPGFVVNRYFVPWLNESVRLLEEGVADIPTIEAACKKTFGVGMGPFELMNVTGVPIALHSAETLGKELGAFYAPAKKLAEQVASKENWSLDGEADESKFAAVEERMLGVIFYVAAALCDEKVGTIEDTDIGARVGLRWPKGPFEMINRYGVDKARSAVNAVCDRWDMKMPATLADQAAKGGPFHFELVKSEVRDGVAYLTINRPDAMNALNETVVGQLHDAFKIAAADDAVKGIVIGGAGKGFIAGADIRFFVKNIEAKDLDRIVRFTEQGQQMLREMDNCSKPVVARMHGLALGGGLELALACDYIVASDKAVMAFPETGIGIYPGLGGTQRPSRRIGVGLTKWMVFTGQMISAKQAEAIGLVDKTVSADQIDAAVLECIDQGPVTERTAQVPPADFVPLSELFEKNPADALREGRVETGGDAKLQKTVGKVAHKAPIALRLAGEMIEEGAKGSLDDGLAMELGKLTEIFATEDAYEGLSSLGRRRPEFHGR
ncbi:hypothetical protein ABI59_22760 [Acidobacteria bacterium Mor1]|nr:hypothetical protein ABI59_22760 [Acidobacteria bacterium Mor1]